jgi:hypothetical protein
VAGSCECGDEPSGSVKRGEFLYFSFSGRPLLCVVSCLLFVSSLKAVIIRCVLLSSAARYRVSYSYLVNGEISTDVM